MRHANHGIRLILTILASFTLTAFAPTARAQAPDFDSVVWTSLSCDAGDPAGDETPSAVDLVGDAAHPAAFIAHDASYLYFRYRVDGNPAGSGGFASYAWNALMQVPSGNPFQYQYELSLDGKNDTVQIWANTSAYDIDFSPLFNDPSDVQLFSTSAATAPLARHLAVNDGSSFGGNTDYFVDFAVPVASLVDEGVIASAAELDAALFFPATATNANNYNKGHLSCPFSPTAALAIDKTVTPDVVPANAMTPLAYKIAVTNGGPGRARGIVIEDPPLPGYFSNPNVSVASDDASVTWTVVHTNPLEVRVNDLPVGATVTVTLATNATPDCGDNAYTNVATAFATNAASVSDSALLSINFVAGGCAPCTTDAECDDANACTTDACVAGGCSSAAIPGCTACAVDANCADDGNACTLEQCVSGVCATSHVLTRSCHASSTRYGVLVIGNDPRDGFARLSRPERRRQVRPRRCHRRPLEAGGREEGGGPQGK